MRRPLLAALACAITLSALATGAATAPAADHKPVTITFWSAYTTRELHDYQLAFVGFHKKYPWITVKGTGNIQDDKIIAAINGGNAPDALLSFSPNNTGKFCSSGAWDEPQRPHREGQVRPLACSRRSRSPTRATTACSARCRRSPTRTGLYIQHRDMLKKAAGLHGPPKTLSELTAMAKKLTVRNPDGSLKVVGLQPALAAYYETTPTAFGHAYGAPVVRRRPASRRSPTTRAGPQMLKWQKSLVDWYGYDKLRKFFGRPRRDEFSAPPTTSRSARSRCTSTASGARRSSTPSTRSSSTRRRRSRRPTASRRCTARGRSPVTSSAIPKGSEAPGRGLAADQVPRHRHPRDRGALATG